MKVTIEIECYRVTIERADDFEQEYGEQAAELANMCRLAMIGASYTEKTANKFFNIAAIEEGPSMFMNMEL